MKSSLLRKICIGSALLALVCSPIYVHALENPFTITVIKGTNKATIQVTSTVGNIIGSTSVSKASSYAFKTCPAVFGSDGRAAPCEVTGLNMTDNYYIRVSASGNNNNTYEGREVFTLGATTVVQPSPTPATTPSTTPTPSQNVPPTPQTSTSTIVVPPMNTTGSQNTAASNSAPTIVSSTTPVVEDEATGGLVPCTDNCGFDHVMMLINNIIEFLITTVFIPIIIILFMTAGFKYITAQGNPAKVANVKKMISNILIGMILVLCSWLIVKTVLSILLADDAGTLQFLE